MLRLLRGFGLALWASLAVVAGLGVIVIGLAVWAPGTAWLVQTSAALSAGLLSVGAVRGTLVGTLEIDALEIVADAARVEIGQIRFDWDPRAALGRRIAVREFTASRVRVTVMPASPAPPSAGGPLEIPALALPVALRIDRLRVDDIEIVQGDTRERIDYVELRLDGAGETMTLENLAARARGVEVVAQGEVGLAPPQRATLRARWQGVVDGVGPVSGETNIAGTLARFTLSQRLDAPFTAKIDGDIEPGLDAPGGVPTPRVNLAGSWENLTWPLGGGGDEGVESGAGRFELSGRMDDFDFTADADVRVPGQPLENVSLRAAGAVDPAAGVRFDVGINWRVGLRPSEGLPFATASGAGRLSGTAAHIDVEHAFEAPFQLTTDGTVDPAGLHTRVALGGEWRDVAWPPGRTDLVSPSGRYRVDGGIDGIDVTVEGALDGAAAPVRRVAIALEGAGAGGQPLPFAGRLNWSAGLPDGVEIAGEGGFTAAAERIEFEHATTRPWTLGMRGAVDLGADGPVLAITGDWRDLRWPVTGPPGPTSPRGRFGLDGPLSELNFTLDASASGAAPLQGIRASGRAGIGSGEAPTFDARLEWEADLGEVGVVRGGGRFDGDAARVRIDHQIMAPFTLTSVGALSLGGASPGVELAGDWAGLAWPLAGTPVAASERGSYRVAGEVQALAVKVAGRAAAPGAPSVDFDVAVTVRPERIDLENIVADTLGGRVEANGHVGFAPQPFWALAVRARDLDPGRQWPGADGRIGLRADVDGKLVDGTPSGTVRLHTLDGKLRGYPLAGSGNVSFTGPNARLDAVKLRSGDNRVAVSGRIGDAVALDLELDAPKMDQLWPGLAGRLGGTARIGGNLANPRVRLDLEGAGIEFEDSALRTLSARGVIDPGNADASRIELVAEQVRVGGQDLASVRVDGTGNAGRHTVGVRIASDLGRLEVDAAGGYKAGEWRGRIAALSADLDRGLGKWQLREPATVRAGAAAGAVERFCIASGDGRICGEGQWRRGGAATATLEATGVPLSLAQSFFPEGVDVAGSVRMAATFKQQARPEGTLSIDLEPGRMTFETDDGEKIEVGYRDTRVRATLAGDTVTAEFGARIAETGTVAADVSLRGWQGDPAQARLAGNVTAALPDIGPLAAWTPLVAEARGAVNARMTIAGTLAGPRLQGRAALEGGALKLPDAGIELQDVAFTASSQGSDVIAIEGGLRSGDGALRVNGEVRLDPGAGFPARIEIVGENVRVLRVPRARVLVSPQLTITTSAEVNRVAGTIVVPSAEITLRSLPSSAVQVTRDEVIVNARGSKAGGAKAGDNGKAGGGGARMEADVTVALGDDVTLSGFGLDTRLAGRLQVRQGDAGLPLANGSLELIEGRYRAYGQDLEIERGRLIFAGPIDNPALDFRAVRKVRQVSAGIAVEGTAKQVRSSIFSEPAMSEAEALSYLLRGRPLSAASQADASVLAEAAVSLGLEGSQAITQQIASTLGLDEVSVGSGGDGGGTEGTALLLGKRLSPDIYIRYALGLFDNTGSLFLNYRLTDSISVEAESGQQQGMDVIYSIERESLFGGGDSDSKQ